MERELKMDNIELNDTQKLYVAMTAATSALNQLTTDFNHDHKILIEGNGDRPIVERVRSLEEFARSIKFWNKTIGISLVGLVFSFISSAIFYFVKLYPLLDQIAKSDALKK